MAKIVMPGPVSQPPPGGLGQKIAETLRYALVSTLEAIGDTLASILDAGFTSLMEHAETELIELSRPGIDYLLSLPNLPPETRQFLGDLRNPKHFAWAPVIAALGVIGSIAGVIGVLGPVSRAGEYKTDRFFHTGRLAPTQALEAVRRGGMRLDMALESIRDQGFDEESINAWKSLVQQYPDLSLLMQFKYRLGVPDSEIRDILIKNGFSDQDAQRILSVMPALPGISDIIMMAVKEAFTPSIAERFGQYEDFPEVFAEEAAKQGLSREWAMRYWAAHWSLPSVQQGYEMLHRGVISQDDLELLLRAQDIMPYWRDKLVKTSYNPYTRVDIRRMYNSGVLTREEVKRAYLDGGYDEEHAEKLTQWTIAQATEEDKALTKGEILDAYKKGILDKSAVTAQLAALGYTAQTIDYLVLMAEYKRTVEKKAPEKALAKSDLVRAFLEGVLSESDLEASLRQLGYDEEETALIVKLAQNESSSRKQSGNRDLAKSEIISAYERGYLKHDETATLLLSLGYDNEEVAFILGLSDWKQADKRVAEEIDIIHQGYINRLIDRLDVIDKLGKLNLPDTTSQRLLYTWDIERTRRMARPTLSQLQSFVKLGIIDLQTFADELAGLGYTDTYIDWYVQAMTKTPAK
jgi:hypothetical protein